MMRANSAPFERHVNLGRRDARAVRERIADGDSALAVGGEFGPDLRDRDVEGGQGAGLEKAADSDRRQSLRTREDNGERIGLPRRPSALVRRATSRLDDRLSIQPNGQGGAAAIRLVERSGERVDDGCEAILCEQIY
jgi:hypothetical protein